MPLPRPVQHRYAVARYPNGGIGDHLSCLIGAWWFAKRTQRTLVIDWRGSRFNSDATKTDNAFAQLFGHYQSLAGVPVICDRRVGDLSYAQPHFPTKWTKERLSDTAHVPHTSQEVDELNQLVTADFDRSEPTVVINQWIDPPPPVEEVRLLLQELKFAQPIREAADRVWLELMGAVPGIAVHIRHGNGENIGGRAAYWLGPFRWLRQLLLNDSVDIHRPGTNGRFHDNMPDSLIRADRLGRSEMKFLRRIHAHTQAMKAEVPGARVILFCDSAVVAQAYKRLDADVVVPPKTFLDANSGPLHAVVRTDPAVSGDPGMPRITHEMAMELELMRRCRGLVCMDSGFTILLKVLLDECRQIRVKPALINRLSLRLYERLDAQALLRKFASWRAARGPRQTISRADISVSQPAPSPVASLETNKVMVRSTRDKREATPLVH